MKSHAITEFKYCAYAPYYEDEWNGKDRITLCDLWFRLSDNSTIKVPQGFVTDLGSVPERLRGFVDNDDESLLGFLLHDWVYKKGTTEYTRKQADEFLYEIIRGNGQSWWRSQKTYWAVRAGGGFAGFGKHYPIIDNGYVEQVLNQIKADYND